MNLAGVGTSLRQNIKKLTGRDVYVAEYEEIKKSDRVNSAGCACYVLRNQWVIDDSDSAMFYLDENKIENKSGTHKVFEHSQSKSVYISIRKYFTNKSMIESIDKNNSSVHN